MGKIILFADHSVDDNDRDRFDFGKEYEAIDQYPTENNQIFVCNQICFFFFRFFFSSEGFG
jgi:hypothetical protein